MAVFSISFVVVHIVWLSHAPADPRSLFLPANSPYAQHKTVKNGHTGSFKIPTIIVKTLIIWKPKFFPLISHLSPSHSNFTQVSCF